MEARMIVLVGVHKGREIALPEALFLIGRDQQCHLRPHCQEVSYLHCAIAAWGGKVRLRDLRSLNGTFVNGQRIHGEVNVADGDQLRVGTLAFAFRISKQDGVPGPTPIMNEQDVGWLLARPDDSEVLELGTDLVPVCVEESTLKPNTPVAQTTRGSKSLSGGTNLRVYLDELQHRQRAPNQTE